MIKRTICNKKKLKVLHTSWKQNHLGGGITNSISILNNSIRGKGLTSDWITSDRFNSIFADRQLFDSLIKKEPSIVHIHGLWRCPTRIATKIAKYKIPYVLSPHGMLNPIAMSQSRLKKKLIWKLWEKKSLNSAKCFHALSLSEVNSIKEYFPDKNIALIPNGINGTIHKKNSLPKPPWNKEIPKGSKVLLFLSRYHDGKGIKPLLKVWGSLQELTKANGWWLVLIGYGDNNKLIEENEKNPIPRCKVLGPSFGLLKHSCYANASAFILPSLFEALPMAALEAMKYKLPTLLSKACNLNEAFEKGASLVCDPEDDSLANSIKRLINLSDNELKEMGLSGRNLVCDNYSSEKVSENMIKLYSWILFEGEKPNFIT